MYIAYTLIHITGKCITVRIYSSLYLYYNTYTSQEPFDRVDEVFKKQLNDDLLQRLHSSLRRFPLDYLLSVLHEFIITHVSHVVFAGQGQDQWP